MLKKTLSIIIIFFPFYTFSQNGICGVVLNAVSKAPVFNASIINGKKSVFTDSLGNFSVKIQTSDFIYIKCSGYKDLQYALSREKKIDTFYLTPLEYQLLEVNITSNKDNLSQTLVKNNYQLLKASQFGNIPTLLGNSDILSALKLLPGVGKGGEGNAGLYIRGGSNGQNMVLFNDAVIYQPAHLLGIFSVFNNSFVNEVRVFKAGIPSQYSGRVSSIIDINSSKQHSDTLNGNATLGFIFSDAAVNIPLSKNWSVKIGARTTFMNLMLWPIYNRNENGNKIGYDFCDFNASSSLKIGKNQLLFSAYKGKDNFNFEIIRANLKNKMDWSNAALSISSLYPINDSIKLQSSFSYSQYYFNFDIAQDNSNIGVVSFIEDWKANSKIAFFLDKHQFIVGLEVANKSIMPNFPQLVNNGLEFYFGPKKIYGVSDLALFFSEDVNISEKISLYGGLRLSYFASKANVETQVKSKNYLVEPSFRLRYSLDKTLNFRVTFSRNIQTLHLLPISTSSFPSDFWMPSTNQIKPERAIQLSAGIFKDWKNYEVYVDFFYKHLNSIIEFNGGIGSLIENLQIEDKIIPGKGRVIGAEFFMRRRYGNFQGILSYTLSRSTRVFNEINSGNQFPFRFDRPHDISLTSSYQISARWKAMLLFTYATGNAYTAPIGRYVIDKDVINEYGYYNGARMPDYHRLDVSASYQFKKKKNIVSEIIFSIYNAYNSANPIFSYYDYLGNFSSGIAVTQKQLKLFPIFPSLTYKVQF